MKPYQERVVAEKKELDERGDKLDQFILSDNFTSLPAAEQERMKRQLRIMGEYSVVLAERIAAFPLSERPSAAVEETPCLPLVGRCVEVGDDESGQPRLVIHTTREELKRFGGNLVFANVAVTVQTGS